MNQQRPVPHDSGMWSRASTIVGGLLLIGIGAVLLAVNTFGMQLPFDFGQIGWPVFVIAPGVALLVVGLIASGEAGEGLAVAGGIVTTVGLILAYQSYTDHWTSWAYAWTLIAPTSVGVAMLLWGTLHRRGSVVRQGLSGIAVGLVLFIVGFAFFEGVLNLGGGRGLAPLGRQALPIALIVAGALVILSRLWPRSRTPERPWNAWGPSGYAGPSAQPYAVEPPPPPPSSAAETQPHASTPAWSPNADAPPASIAPVAAYAPAASPSESSEPTSNQSSDTTTATTNPTGGPSQPPAAS